MQALALQQSEHAAPFKTKFHPELEIFTAMEEAKCFQLDSHFVQFHGMLPEEQIFSSCGLADKKTKPKTTQNRPNII